MAPASYAVPFVHSATGETRCITVTLSHAQTAAIGAMEWLDHYVTALARQLAPDEFIPAGGPMTLQ